MIVETIVGGWINFDDKSRPFCPGSPISYSLDFPGFTVGIFQIVPGKLNTSSPVFLTYSSSSRV